MTSPRFEHTATLLPNGKVLIAGGDDYGDSSLAFASAELYIAGGGQSPDGLYGARAELYEPSTGTFAATGSLTRSRYAHSATLLSNGKVLIAGGNNDRAVAEVYDPTTALFTATGTMTTNRWGHTATLLPDGDVLITGGGSGNVSCLASAELYDPCTGTFTSTGSMTVGRDLHTATPLLDGRVLITGGLGEPPQGFASAELYDPDRGDILSHRRHDRG